MAVECSKDDACHGRVFCFDQGDTGCILARNRAKHLRADRSVGYSCGCLMRVLLGKDVLLLLVEV